MKHFIDSISDRRRLFFFTILLILIIASIFLFVGKTYGAIIIAIISIVILTISRPIWLSDNHGKTFVRKSSLFLTYSLIVSYGIFNQSIQYFGVKIIQSVAPNFGLRLDNEIASSLPVYFIFIIWLLIVFIVNHYNKDGTAMGIHPENLNKDFPELNYSQKLTDVAKYLRDELESIDRRTNWHSDYYTPLDAEVEIVSGRSKRKKVDDLLNAIKRSNKRLFLVLGYPGAGKSVALRKLCQDLTKEVKITGKIPIYINLNEWKWTEGKSPTKEDLLEFVKIYLDKKDIITGNFFRNYFDKMYESGRIYFVFDSFDEIPNLLAEKEDSPLVDEVSKILYNFLKGAQPENSRGILASRIFRKPTSEFNFSIELEIRPFSEDKILRNLKNHEVSNENLINELFKSRPELLSIARNPFNCSLLIQFWKKNTSLPINQMELYEYYIKSTFENCFKQFERSNLNSQIVHEYTIKFAQVMLDKYGIEVSVSQLSNELNEDYSKIQNIVQALKYSRIMRGSISDDTVVAFSHRRFAEFFYVQAILEDDVNTLDLDSIPNDSKQRDVLVLLCQVAPSETTNKIIEYCIQYLINSSKVDIGNKISLHILRFLFDAFIGRINLMQNFIDQITEVVIKNSESRDIRIIKWTVEFVGIIRKEERENILLNALRKDNYWVNDTVIRNCKFIKDFSDTFTKKICRIIFKKNSLNSILEFQELYFTIKILGLSKPLFFLRLHLITSIMTFCSLLILGFLIPLMDLFKEKLIVIFIYLGLYALFIGSTGIFSHYLKFRFYIPKQFMFERMGILYIQTSLLIALLLSTKVLLLTKIVLMLFFIPYSTIYYTLMGIKFKNLFKKLILSIKDIRNNLREFLMFIGILFILVGIIYLVNWLNKKIFLIPLGVLGLLLLYWFVQGLINNIKDLKRISDLNISQMKNRVQISDFYYALESNYGKRKFVFCLEQNVQKVEGIWPNSEMFHDHFGYKDNSIIELAKLDEKWEGLNR